MKKMIRKILILWLFMFSIQTQAALVKNGSVISDPGSGLDWLEFSLSADITYNQMLNNFNDTNSVFYGYQYATWSQIETLLLNQGFVGGISIPDTNVSDTDSINAVLSVYGTFGQTGTDARDRSDAMFLNENGGLVDWLYLYLNPSSSWVSTRYDFINPDADFYASNSNNKMASWVVRDTPIATPLPASVWLFGTGLLGLIGVARKKAT